MEEIYSYYLQDFYQYINNYIDNLEEGESVDAYDIVDDYVLGLLEGEKFLKLANNVKKYIVSNYDDYMIHFMRFMEEKDIGYIDLCEDDSKDINRWVVGGFLYKFVPLIEKVAINVIEK